MPDVSLPTGAVRAPRGPKTGPGFNRRGRGGRGQFVAHDIEAKSRTEDVITSESREKTFADLLISAPVLKGLTNAGFHRPSPVQLQAIPPAKVGFDCIVQSKSGTGKTCVYVVTALEMVKPELQALQVLVLAPTREIAVQGVNVAMQIGQQLSQVKIQAFIGGLSLAEDKVRARSCQVCVGTPGRLKQLISEGLLNVENVRLAVLDEADKMLEASFINDTTWILNMLPTSKQVMALSATYPDKLASLAERFMRSPHHIRPGEMSQVLTGVLQLVLPVSQCPVQHKQNTIKQTALLSLLSSLPYTQCLVFSNYTSIAQATADYLNSRGFPAVFMSAVQDQARRMAVMETFRQFNTRILCSTDLTARGIDAENVNLVINMEVPWEHNTYLHRIGRGGRFGSHSLAVSLVAEGQEMERMRGMVAKTGSEVRVLDKENIPSNVRDHVDGMEILTGATVAQVTDGADNVSGDEFNTRCKSKSSRRRAPKKTKSTNDECENSTNVSGNEDRLLQMKIDSEIVSDHVETLKGSKSDRRITWEQISELSEKLSSDNFETLEFVKDEPVAVPQNVMKNVSKSLDRLSKFRQEEINSKLNVVRDKTSNLSLEEMMKLLESGSNLFEIETSAKNETRDNVEVKLKESLLEESNDSESSSSESSSSSDSDSESSSSDSSSSDSDSESSDDECSSVNPSPGHPSVSQSWYHQWYTAVSYQRQMIQAQEYHRYLQYYGYK